MRVHFPRGCDRNVAGGPPGSSNKAAISVIFGQLNYCRRRATIKGSGSMHGPKTCAHSANRAAGTPAAFPSAARYQFEVVPPLTRAPVRGDGRATENALTFCLICLGVAIQSSVISYQREVGGRRLGRPRSAPRRAHPDGAGRGRDLTSPMSHPQKIDGRVSRFDCGARRSNPP